jgi:hypothetical protein
VGSSKPVSPTAKLKIPFKNYESAVERHIIIVTCCNSVKIG